MANAPASTDNAARKEVTIYDSEGNSIVATRLNAVDLVRSGGYHWKAEDAKNSRPESAGPADPTSKTQTIYNATGEAVEATAANAREMVQSGDYFWNDPSAVVAPVTEEQALDELIDAAHALAETTGEAVVEPTAETSTEQTTPEQVVEPSAEPVDPSKEALLDQALRVTGNDDVAAYLEGFAEGNLRDMAKERYGENLHHRAAKATMIGKIIELENARTAAGDVQEDA